MNIWECVKITMYVKIKDTKIQPDVNKNGFDVIIRKTCCLDDENPIIIDKKYYYDENVTLDEENATVDKPYVSSLLHKLAFKYDAGIIFISPGKHKLAKEYKDICTDFYKKYARPISNRTNKIIALTV